MAEREKFVIGLTGNIATGKSVVRKMLEHLGAYGIDADALAHRAIVRGGPGYQAVVDTFGQYILDKNQEINRQKLGKLVFSDAEALEKLEAIVHPYVRQAVDYLSQNAEQYVVVVEAIKLLESPLKEKTNSIWVVSADEEVQIKRLAEKRKMSAAESRARMESQSSQVDKILAADVVILNNGSYDETWQQVQSAWQKLLPGQGTGDTIIYQRTAAEADGDEASAGLAVVKARPRQAEDIANFINRLSGGKQNLSRMDVMAAFGEKAYLLLTADQALVGLVGWQVENLIARIDEILLEPSLDVSAAVKSLMTEVETASRQLQAEVAMAFVKPDLAENANIWAELGYERRAVDSLAAYTWQEAAQETLQDGMVMLFKQLRVDPVLRPI